MNNLIIDNASEKIFLKIISEKKNIILSMITVEKILMKL